MIGVVIRIRMKICLEKKLFPNFIFSLVHSPPSARLRPWPQSARLVPYHPQIVQGKYKIEKYYILKIIYVKQCIFYFSIYNKFLYFFQ